MADETQSSSLLIGVGGGGQHVALALARLVRLGVWRTPPEVYLIDADNNPEVPLARQLLTFDETVDERSRRFVAHPLPSAQRIEPPFKRQKVTGRFEDIFLGTNRTEVRSNLFKLFFSDDLANTDVSKGMFARPCIGSAVFGFCGVEDLGEDIKAKAKAQRNVLVAGSFVGGTGAGISHQLIRYLRQEMPTKEIYGSFLLRTFLIRGETTLPASDRTVNASMIHGLEYFFRETHRHLTWSALVGVPDGDRLPEADSKGAETPSRMPLFALFALDQISRDSKQSGAQEIDQARVSVLTTAPDDPYWLLRMPWVGTDRTSRIDVAWLEAQLLGDTYRLMMKHEKRWMPLGWADTRGRELFIGLNSVALGPWHEVLGRLAERYQVGHQEFAELTLTAFEARLAQLDACTKWLEKRDVFAGAPLHGAHDALDRSREVTTAKAKENGGVEWVYTEVFAPAYRHVQGELGRMLNAPPPGKDTAAGEVASLMERALREQFRQ